MSVLIFFLLFIQLKTIDFGLFYRSEYAFLAPSLFGLLKRLVAELLSRGDLREVGSVRL